MTKKEILEKIEPRSVKLIKILNSWGPIGDKNEPGWQWLDEEHFKKAIWVVTTCVAKKDVPETPAGFVFKKAMRFGSKIADVIELQKHLQDKGFMNKGITPVANFGKITLAAVKKWQAANGLVADGIVGPASLKVLNKI